MESLNPATGDVVETFDEHDESAVEEKLQRASDTYEEWHRLPIEERQRLIANAADVLRDNKEEYAETMTTEMGKPLDAAVSEVEKCAWVCDYYAEHAAEFLQDEHIGTESEVESYVSYEPLGPVLAVMPWNFPFWQVFRFAAPNLTAGNVGLLKHASNVPGCAMAIQEVFEEAGFPDGAFTSPTRRVGHRGGHPRGRPSRGGDAHGERTRGPRGRRDGREQPQEDRPRTRRQRPVRRPSRRRRRRRGENGRAGPLYQQRPVLYRGQTLRRPRRRVRRVHGHVRRTRWSR